MLLVSVLLIAYTITNTVLMYFRKAPFIFADFYVLKSALSIMNIYMTKLQMIFSVIGIVAALTLLIWLVIKENPKKTDYKKVLALIVISVLISFIPSGVIIKAKNESKTTNITDEAYLYGFVCCFANSAVNNGVIEPDVYSKKNIESILSESASDAEAPDVLPNIVVIQLESFIDPELIDGAKYSSEPVPNFRQLKENYSSGKLDVAVFGGGTANTEFEVLTNMNIRHFGIGEYPYETVLRDSVCESVCYTLRDLGYTSHALHNHTGTFYDRNIVYKNLGFDYFTPGEYMDGLEYNILGWEKSRIFTGYIEKALSSTPGPDFIFTVTSQEHGRYPVHYSNPSKNAIKVSGTEEIKAVRKPLEYYCDELHDEDEWLQSLLDTLSSFDEPTVAVIYGDHFPAITLPQSMNEGDRLYQTEYVIWQNFRSPKKDKELYTFQLLPEVLSRIGITGGNFIRLNQYGLKEGIDYNTKLHMLQYDMLYGDRYMYDEAEELPFTPSDMKFGYDPIEITSVEIKKNDTAVIKGNNFTTASVVYIDGRSAETEFIDSETLIVSSSEIKDFTRLVVSQRAPNYTVLASSKPYINNENKDDEEQ